MRWAASPLSLLWVAWSLCACSSNRKLPVDAKVFCSRLSEAAVTTWQTCRGVDATVAAVLFEDEFGCARRLLLEEQRRLEVDIDLADECLRNARASCLTLDAALTSEGSCARAFTANSRQGDDCVSEEECFDRRCIRETGACSGRCVFPRTAGQPCAATTDCTRDAFCGSNQKCTAYPQRDQACSDGLCTPGTICSEGRCRALPQEGEGCANNACAVPLLCLNVAGQKTCVSPYAVSDAMTGCVNSCGPIARCVTSPVETEPNRCEVLAPQGAACTVSNPCRAGLTCTDGLCAARPSGIAFNQTCVPAETSCSASTCDPATSTCGYRGISAGCFIH